MRTTLTIDDDVAARLVEQQRRRRVPFRHVVNEALRAGLDAVTQRPARTRFSTSGLSLGPSLVGSLDNVEEVLARIEGERHR